MKNRLSDAAMRPCFVLRDCIRQRSFAARTMEPTQPLNGIDMSSGAGLWSGVSMPQSLVARLTQAIDDMLHGGIDKRGTHERLRLREAAVETAHKGNDGSSLGSPP